MKKILMLITCVNLICINSVFAQSADTYSKIGDIPDEAMKGHIGLEFYGIDAGFKNISGSMIFAFGANTRYPINDKLTAEGLIRMPLLRFEKSGAAFLADGGVLLKLNSHDITKTVNVILGYKEEDNVYTRTSTTKYVPVSGTVIKTRMARGGVYLKNTAIKYSENSVDYKNTNVFHKGIYVGIASEKKYLFLMQQNRNNGATKFAAGNLVMLYADLLLLPTSVELQQETYGLGAGVTEELKGFIGARVGFKWYRNPFTRSQNFDRGLPFFGNCFYFLEGGFRPIEGIFVSGGVSYMLHKF